MSHVQQESQVHIHHQQQQALQLLTVQRPCDGCQQLQQSQVEVTRLQKLLQAYQLRVGPAVSEHIEQTLQAKHQQLWYLSKRKCFRFNGKWETLPFKCTNSLYNRIGRMSYGGVDCVVWMYTNGKIVAQDVAFLRPAEKLSSPPDDAFQYGTSMVIHNNVLYAIGCGKDMRGIYALQPSATQWQLVGITNAKHVHAAVGVIGDKIYISGHRGTECYDIVTKNCAIVSGQSKEHSGYCVYQNKLYVAGGAGDVAVLRCYDPVSDKWTRLADMSAGRYRLSLGVYNDQLWAIGDDVGSHEVESYEVTQNKWRSEPDLPARCGFGGAIAI
eukprot:TRINITY_DN4196_c0_g1_i1.p1 TRINITY_DN4196_c0_g1~~TRINITY_DN4196_c0_g1_i1.p1  ORF type:complete len:354 (+),score=75.11 TRINITY_DN4196_c0_g1_i1:83-1063(+)